MSQAPANALELRAVTKRYGPVTALADVFLTVPRHCVVGLVGENGAGKSTLISVINGTVRPDTGSILINGDAVSFGHPQEAARHGVATVFQEQGLIPNLRVFENMLLGREAAFSRAGLLRRDRMVALTREVLDELQIDVSPTAVTGSLPFGQRQMVEIAKAFTLSRIYPVEPIILLDEPTSALSDRETELLFASIRRWRSRASIVLVSHRLSDVFTVCEQVAALKDGQIVRQWPVAAVREDELHEAIVGRKRTLEYYKEARQRRELGEVVLELRDVGEPGQLERLSLQLRAGEIVGVAGVLGSGKSLLGEAVTGARRPRHGEILLDGRRLRPGSREAAIAAGMGSVPAERNLAGVIGPHSVEWNLTLPSLRKLRGPAGLLSARRAAEVTDQWIRRLRVRTPGRSIQIRRLSGGNAQKVVFAKWLARGVRVLVLDDPGRGLDVGAKEEIYTLLRDLADGGTAILLISDNLPEIIGLSNRIVVLRGGAVSAEIAAPPDAKPREADVVRAMV